MIEKIDRKDACQLSEVAPDVIAYASKSCPIWNQIFGRVMKKLFKFASDATTCLKMDSLSELEKIWQKSLPISKINQAAISDSFEPETYSVFDVDTEGSADELTSTTAISDEPSKERGLKKESKHLLKTANRHFETARKSKVQIQEPSCTFSPTSVFLKNIVIEKFNVSAGEASNRWKTVVSTRFNNLINFAFEHASSCGNLNIQCTTFNALFNDSVTGADLLTIMLNTVDLVDQIEDICGVKFKSDTKW